MKITQRIKSYAALALGLCLLGAGMTGCIKDEYGARETTTVRLTVSTRSDHEDQNNQPGHNLEPNEEMKTLRVIVARSSNNEIIYNWYEDNIADNDFERTINFSELTILTTGENFDFYAIANEASFLSAGESLEGKDIDLGKLKDCILNNDFNAADAGQIPQTAFATQTVIPGTTDNLYMQLKFVVAKVYVGFINETGKEQTVSNLTLLDSNPRKGYLFGLEEGRIPDDITIYEDLPVAASVNVPAGATADTPGVYAYLYPGRSTEENAYILQGTWNGDNHFVNDETITSNQGVVSELKRGQQLNIIITLLGGEHEYEFNCQVNAWGEKEMTVPPFE